MFDVSKKIFKYEKINQDQELEKIEKTEEEQIDDIVSFLNLKFAFHNLKMLNTSWSNSFLINDNLIFLYPLNDGMPTCCFNFYQGNELVIDNKKEYTQLANLDDIVLQMVRVFNKALDNNIVLDPYGFMLELTDDVCKDYHGNAELVITDEAIRNPKLNEENFDEANKYFINRFLDHFIGWNFGLSVHRNEQLKSELEQLNEKVIAMGIREYAGSSFDIRDVEDEEINELQCYTLPTEKSKVKKRSLN